MVCPEGHSELGKPREKEANVDQGFSGWLRLLGVVAAVSSILKFSRDFKRLSW